MRGSLPSLPEAPCEIGLALGKIRLFSLSSASLTAVNLTTTRLRSFTNNKRQNNTKIRRQSTFLSAPKTSSFKLTDQLTFATSLFHLWGEEMSHSFPPSPTKPNFYLPHQVLFSISESRKTFPYVTKFCSWQKTKCISVTRKREGGKYQAV